MKTTRERSYQSHLGPGLLIGFLFLLLVTAGCGSEDSGAVSPMSADEPSVVNTSPADGTSGVDPETSIMVTFNKAMLKTSITADTDQTNSSCTGTIQLSPNGFSSCVTMSGPPSISFDEKTYIFTPADSLSPDTTYKLKVEESIMDIALQRLNADYVTPTGFSTAADGTSVDNGAAPYVVSVWPPDGTSDVRLNTHIQVTFSEPMVRASITAKTDASDDTCTGTIQVSGGVFNTCIAMQNSPMASVDDKTYLLYPKDALSGETTYRIKVRRSVTDTSLTPMDEDFVTYNGFTTIKEPTSDSTGDSTNDASGDQLSVQYVDISAGQPSNSGRMPDAIIDTTAQKLLVVTQNDANFSRLSLFRCNLDGTSCSHHDLTDTAMSTFRDNSGLTPSAAIGNGSLIVITRNSSDMDRPYQFVCNLDGSGCTYRRDVSNAMSFSGYNPSIRINSGMLYVATRHDNTGINRAGYFRISSYDGSTPMINFYDISNEAGLTDDTGLEPAMALNVNLSPAKVLIAARDSYNSNRLRLYRFDEDSPTTTTSSLDISATGPGDSSGYTPAIGIDSVNAKLIMVTKNAANANKPLLFRCNLDGTGCTSSDISSGQGTDSGANPDLYVNTTGSGDIFVVTQDDSNSGKPALFRCDLDGTQCSYHDISAGRNANSGWNPSVVFDSANNKLLVVVQDNSMGDKLGLFIVSFD